MVVDEVFEEFEVFAADVAADGLGLPGGGGVAGIGGAGVEGQVRSVMAEGEQGPPGVVPGGHNTHPFGSEAVQEGEGELCVFPGVPLT